MLNSVVLSREEELRAERIAGTLIGKTCIGFAKIFKGTGLVLEKSTKMTAAGLRATANTVEKAGEVSSNYCYDKANNLTAKANDYKIQSEEDIAEKELQDYLDKIQSKGYRIQSEEKDTAEKEEKVNFNYYNKPNDFVATANNKGTESVEVTLDHSAATTHSASTDAEAMTLNASSQVNEDAKIELAADHSDVNLDNQASTKAEHVTTESKIDVISVNVVGEMPTTNDYKIQNKGYAINIAPATIQA